MREYDMARPQLEYIPADSSRSFVFKIDRDIWPVYHFHPELDILLVLKNTGHFISGDHVGRMEPGTLFMNGPNVPHALHPVEGDDRDWDRPALAVLQFSPQTMGKEWLEREEMTLIRDFLAEAGRGFEFHGPDRDAAARKILEMRDQDEVERLATFLLVLRILAKTPDRTPLASEGYQPSLRREQIERVDRVVRYLQQNLREPLTLETVAQIANLTPRAFCRFFKAHMGKTLVQYLNELRIGEACRLLMETDLPVTEVALECGFYNLSNFNRRFRQLKGSSPREFRQQSQLSESLQSRPMPEHVYYS